MELTIIWNFPFGYNRSCKLVVNVEWHESSPFRTGIWIFLEYIPFANHSSFLNLFPLTCFQRIVCSLIVPVLWDQTDCCTVYLPCLRNLSQLMMLLVGLYAVQSLAERKLKPKPVKCAILLLNHFFFLIFFYPSFSPVSCYGLKKAQELSCKSMQRHWSTKSRSTAKHIWFAC